MSFIWKVKRIINAVYAAKVDMFHYRIFVVAPTHRLHSIYFSIMVIASMCA